MKLTINGVEVTINVKENGESSKEAAMYLLNEIAIVYGEASEIRKMRNLETTSEKFSEISNKIHCILEKEGFYDEVRKEIK